MSLEQRRRLQVYLPDSVTQRLRRHQIAPHSVVRGLFGDLLNGDPRLQAWFEARYGVPFPPVTPPRNAGG